ncbi:MAG: hypothetical protein KA142_02330 [Chromatiaceae bacterium]|nr:hypothetical protein [Chromatiaceae bacterium]
MMAWQERLLLEKDALSEKIVKLNDFLISEAYIDIDSINRLLIETQLDYMIGYHNILHKRIEIYLNATTPFELNISNKGGHDQQCTA